ncbi:MAG TPA: PHB depolymerase family esterase [Fimbriimonadaceae bacterium]|nr:PHB depolymerase family esterase [Fimbriimonadaceae bacterium]
MKSVLPFFLLCGCAQQQGAPQAPQGQSRTPKPPVSQTKPGKTPPPVYSAGDHPETLKEDKVDRTYIVHVPKEYDGKHPIPVVMLLHGWTGSAKTVQVHTGMAAEADKDGFVLVAPDGLGKPQGWNCGFLNIGGEGADDVKFLTDVLDEVGKKVKVDPKRIFVAGHSNGAMMSYVLGSKLSARIAAIGVVAGTIGFDQGPQQARVDAPAHPISALIIHGLLDPTVPYDHGEGLLQNCYSAPASAAFWAKADGIVGPPTVKSTAKGNIEERIWRSGRIEVELITIGNGTHDWPGGVNWDGPETKTGLDAAERLWGFFKHHPKA